MYYVNIFPGHPKMFALDGVPGNPGTNPHSTTKSSIRGSSRRTHHHTIDKSLLGFCVANCLETSKPISGTHKHIRNIISFKSGRQGLNVPGLNSLAAAPRFPNSAIKSRDYGPAPTNSNCSWGGGRSMLRVNVNGTSDPVWAGHCI